MKTILETLKDKTSSRTYMYCTSLNKTTKCNADYKWFCLLMLSLVGMCSADADYWYKEGTGR